MPFREPPGAEADETVAGESRRRIHNLFARYQLLRDDIASVAYWYQAEPHAPFPTLPPRDVLELK